MTNADARDAADAQVAPADVGPEAIAALIAQGAAALALPAHEERPADPTLDLLVQVTHDLRSPLSAMLVLIERLRSGQAGPVTPQQEALLGMLYAAAFGAGTLTRDALDLARGGAGAFTTGPLSAFSLAATWRTVRALVHPLAEERRLTLRWSGPESDGRIGREALLQRVLLNLVTNALKYTERGAVTVMVSEVAPDYVRVAVADTGTGLPAAVQLFLQTVVSEAPQPALPGASSPSTSLGLVMCQHLLASVGSRLELETTGPHGTRLAFTMALPCPT